MEKFFNTAGPIKPNIHYFVDSQKRWDFGNLVLEEQQLRLTKEGEQGTHILKPIPRDLKKWGKYLQMST